jgi:hypothetical protein
MRIVCRHCNDSFEPECPACGDVEQIDLPEPPSFFCRGCGSLFKVGDVMIPADDVLDQARQQQRAIFTNVGLQVPLESLTPMELELTRIFLEEGISRYQEELRRLNDFARPVFAAAPVRKQ